MIMETKFNFNSQVCTDVNQSRKLLALGLKKETADCYWVNPFNEWFPIVDRGEQGIDEDDIPAWSLHRLIETLPLLLRKGDNYSLVFDIHRDWVAYMTYASGERNPYNRYLFESQNTNTYDAFIDCIEWLIKEGYFNKEYLV